MICSFPSVALDNLTLPSSKYIMKYVQSFLSGIFGLQQNTLKYMEPLRSLIYPKILWVELVILQVLNWLSQTCLNLLM